MKKKTLLSISLTATITLGAAVALWAAVPPPPVNQNLFIYDTSFANFTVANCHECHGPDQTPPGGTPVGLVDQHHALLNNVPAPTCINTSGTAPSTLATGCHIIVPNPAGGFTLQDPTNCFNCHNSSPHHTTTFAAAQDCKHCHGAAIDNPLDGHYIPAYAMNTAKGGFTPAPVGRIVPDPANPGQTLIEQGCAACHQANPAATPRPISSNQDTHHGTGIGSGNPGSVGTCTWCHGSGANSFTIRACEACHGVNSLHSIQADSPNAANLGTIIPGNENLGYGHIGNNWDCYGCHQGWNGLSTSGTTVTVPSINGMSSKAVIAGQAATLTINGSGFTNSDTSGNTVTPVVTLTNNGTTTTLTPFSTTVSEIQVLLPTTLPVGVYELRVDKSGTVSNLSRLVVIPKVTVKSAILSGQTLTITGAGFGPAPTAQFKALLGVKVDGTAATVVTWSDTKIVATSPTFAAGKTAMVNTLFGQVAGDIFGAAKKVK